MSVGAMTPTFYHYSAEPLLGVHSVIQSFTSCWKPVGLWITDNHGGPSWPEWCQGENYELGRLKYETSVQVDTSRVLLIKNEHDLRIQHRLWGEDKYYGDFKSYGKQINWGRIHHDTR